MSFLGATLQCMSFLGATLQCMSFLGAWFDQCWSVGLVQTIKFFKMFYQHGPGIEPYVINFISAWCWWCVLLKTYACKALFIYLLICKAQPRAYPYPSCVMPGQYHMILVLKILTIS
jgi:hypothetical protein